MLEEFKQIKAANQLACSSLPLSVVISLSLTTVTPSSLPPFPCDALAQNGVCLANNIDNCVVHHGLQQHENFDLSTLLHQLLAEVTNVHYNLNNTVELDQTPSKEREEDFILTATQTHPGTITHSKGRQTDQFLNSSLISKQNSQ